MVLGLTGGDYPSGVSAAEVRRELDRVLSSPTFEASPRNRAFLRYVIEETLAGRANRIKAYSIATRVFGRADDFDPMQDSIVRIEAGRLRRALDYCYLKGGSAGLRLVIPKGTYVPTFLREGETPDVAAPPDAQASALHELGPRIMVRSFEQDGDGAYPTLARTLTRQVISALTRFTELFVYGFDTSEGLASTEAGQGLRIDYDLVGTVTVSAASLHAELLLRKAGDGRFIWAEGIERGLGPELDPARVVSLCTEIAGHVARTIALRDGIMDSQARDYAGDAPTHFAGYQKLLDFQDYWRSLEPSLFEPLRHDLERTIARDPRFSAAFACLSLLYSNAARYGYDVGEATDAPLGRALELARKAIHLAPNSSRAYHARAVAEWFSGRPENSLTTLQIARSLNPNEPELLAELGFRSAMRMEWETGVPLIEEAYARSPLQSGQYRMGLFLFHFSEGRYERALQEARAIDSPGIVYVHIAEAAALGALGRPDEAGVHLAEAERLAPGLRLRLREDLAFRQIHPELTAAILRALGAIDPDWAPAVSVVRSGSR